MKKSRLTNLLSSFDTKDWKKFLKHLKVNAKNNGEVLRITAFLEKQNRKTQLEFLETENIRIFSKTKLNKQSFANAINTLCNEIERYFVFQELETDDILYESIVIKTLAKRGLSDNFYKRKEKIVDRAYRHDLWQDYFQFLIYHYEYFYNINKKKYESGKILDQAYDKLKSFISNMSHFYSLEMHNRHVIIGEDWKKQLHHSNQLMVVDTNTSEIFDQLILLKVDKKESAFWFLKEELLDSDEKISKELQNAIYIHLTSYLNHKIKNGQTERILELLKLYEIGFEKEIINFAGQMSVRQFLTVINTACDLKAFDWVDKFVNKWISSIDAHIRPEILNLSLATILFAREEYIKVIESLNSIKLKIFDHEYRVKWLLLMSLYEINPEDIDILLREIRNFKYFAKVNKYRMENTTFEAINNSLDYLNKIIINKLKDRDRELFNSNSTFIRKRWLLEKSQKIDFKK